MRVALQEGCPFFFDPKYGFKPAANSQGTWEQIKNDTKEDSQHERKQTGPNNDQLAA